MEHDEHEHGAGQGGGTGGTVGSEGAVPTGERATSDPDAWDAKPADEELTAEELSQDTLRPRGSAGEDEGETEGGRRFSPADEPMPGAEQPRTADAVEGGTGRPL